MLGPRTVSFSLALALGSPALAQTSRFAVTAGHDLDSVSVVDLDTFQEVAVIPTGGSKPIEVSASPDGRTAYVLHQYGDGGSANVSVVDLASMTASALPTIIPQ